jgi:HEAT repeat protein
MAENKDPIFRVYALEALQQLYDIRLFNIVQTLLSDENKSVRIIAIKCVQTNNMDRLVSNLKNMALSDVNAEVRVEAISALMKMNDSGAHSVYNKTINSDNRDIRFVTAQAMHKLKSRQSLSAASEQLAVETDIPIKGILIDFMIEMKDGGGLKGLEREALNEEHAPLRIKSVYALGVIGGSKALPILMKAIADTDFHVRAEACASLGGYKDKNVSAALIGVVRDDRERYVRLAALYSLERIRDKSTVVPLYDQHAKEQDPVFRSKLYEVTRTLIQGSI